MKCFSWQVGDKMHSLSVLYALLSKMNIKRPQIPDEHNVWTERVNALVARDDFEALQRCIVLAGSSSIALWPRSLMGIFPKPVINHGFGGSTLSDLIYFAPKLINQYRPRIVILYCGENDIVDGSTPSCVMDRMANLHDSINDSPMSVETLIISLKPTPGRWRWWKAMHRTNKLLAEYCRQHIHCSYVDVAECMTGRDGRPIERLFLGDGIHMSWDGYQVWARTLRAALYRSY